MHPTRFNSLEVCVLWWWVWCRNITLHGILFCTSRTQWTHKCIIWTKWLWTSDVSTNNGYQTWEHRIADLEILFFPCGLLDASHEGAWASLPCNVPAVSAEPFADSNDYFSSSHNIKKALGHKQAEPISWLQTAGFLFFLIYSMNHSFVLGHKTWGLPSIIHLCSANHAENWDAKCQQIFYGQPLYSEVEALELCLPLMFDPEIIYQASG